MELLGPPEHRFVRRTIFAGQEINRVLADPAGLILMARQRYVTSCHERLPEETGDCAQGGPQPLETRKPRRMTIAPTRMQMARGVVAPTLATRPRTLVSCMSQAEFS